MNEILILLTGGTIDSYYYPPTETSIPYEQSVIPDFIEDKILPHDHFTYETICMLDSGDITNEIREEILDTIKGTDIKKIMIVHGTTTMQKTSSFLAKSLKGSDKTIILVGAMIPLKEFAMSDGGFNLGYALGKIQDAPSGVYIAMNGRLFPAGTATKNASIGRFIEAE